MKFKLNSIRTGLLSLMIITGDISIVHAKDLIIDNRMSDDLYSNLGMEWRLFTDQVMGGISRGSLSTDSFQNRKCLRMQGDVSTENNGGFVQMVLSLSKQKNFDASAYTGIEIEIAGNNEDYNLHLRTSSLWLPWQSYRASFRATDDWQKISIPFSAIKAYKTTQKFRADKLSRIGLVAIGRQFRADLCLASMRFYS